MPETDIDSPARARQRAVAFVAALATVGFVGTLLGLSIPLLSFALEARGVTNLFNGLNTASAAIGMMLSAPFAPMMARRIGVRGLMLCTLLVGALSLMALYAISPLWTSFPLRFVFGGAIGIMFVLSEFWINAVVSDRRRGLAMGLYAITLSTGFGLGSALVYLLGVQGIAPYACGVVLFGLAAVPLMLAGLGAPELPRRGETRLLPYFIAAPAAMLAAFVFGAVEMGTLNFLPLYGEELGYAKDDATLFLSVLAAGNVAIQLPIGWIADHMDRRKLLLILSSIGAAGAGVMPMVVDMIVPFFVLLFVLGGLIAALYTVGLAHLGGRFQGAALANANAAFILCYALGMLVGPPALGRSMDVLPPHGLAYAVAVMLSLYSGLVILRALGRPFARLDFAGVLRRLRAQ